MFIETMNNGFSLSDTYTEQRINHVRSDIISASLPLSEVPSPLLFALPSHEEGRQDDIKPLVPFKQTSNDITATNNYNTGSSSRKGTLVARREKNMLPTSFTPGPYDVICARGKVAKHHSGNVYFRQLIDKYYMDYGNATTRFDKTRVVSSIVEAIRSNCSEYGAGGFVKLEKNRWYEIGENGAREKVGQHLREKLHTKYKSSTKAKRRMKKEMKQKIEEHFDAFIADNLVISNKIHRLSDTITKHMTQEVDEDEMSDSTEIDLELAMTQANSAILSSLKTGDSIQRLWREQ